MKIAISGKGGVGKTTIAAGLVKLFARNHQTVYAIDADPDACLATAIGIPEEEAAAIKPIVEMKDLIKARSGDGVFYVLNPKVDDVIEDYSFKLGRIRFLRMGGIKKGGSECYCRENTFLHALVSSLLLDKDEVVILDMGAGIEHLTRGTARGVDLMLVVVEPSRNSINTAKIVQQMAVDLGIENIRIIGNKIRSEKEKSFIRENFGAHEVLGFIEFSDAIWTTAMEQADVAEAEEGFWAAMEEICSKIKREVGDKSLGRGEQEVAT